jgi:ParB family chromosome partitioning protein
VEIALSYQRLISECSLKQEELGDRVGKKRTTVNNYLRLLKLPPDIQAGLRDGKLNMGHGRALINIDNIDLQLSIYKRILDEDLSVRKVEDLVRELAEKVDKKDPASKKAPDYALIQAQSKLSGRFGTKVQIKKGTDNKGEIKIPFVSEDDLNRILDILG